MSATQTPRALRVKQVAVLGAGVMGAQIAAHLVNVRVPVVLFDLPAKGADGAVAATESARNGIVTRAIEGLKKLKPAPLGADDPGGRLAQHRRQDR